MIKIKQGILTLAGIRWRKRATTALEQTSTNRVASPMPRPCSALVVTASTGHNPSSSLKTAFSFQMPRLKSVARLIGLLLCDDFILMFAVKLKAGSHRSDHRAGGNGGTGQLVEVTPVFFDPPIIAVQGFINKQRFVPGFADFIPQSRRFGMGKNFNCMDTVIRAHANHHRNVAAITVRCHNSKGGSNQLLVFSSSVKNRIDLPALAVIAGGDGHGIGVRAVIKFRQYRT